MMTRSEERQIKEMTLAALLSTASSLGVVNFGKLSEQLDNLRRERVRTNVVEMRAVS